MSTEQEETDQKHDDYNDCILSMYAIDSQHNEARLTSLKFRVSPFLVDVHSNDAYQIVNDLVQYDKKNNIYYYHLGSKQKYAKMEQLFFFTPNLKWPSLYTMIIWIEWENCNHCLTTMDSSGDSPIFVNTKGELGCASHEYGWKTINNYKIKYDKWQFIVAFGGNQNTDFYIGDLYNLPKYIQCVECDIANSITRRIGNYNQGPGKVASLFIYKGHLNIDDIIDLYFESILVMGQPWSAQKKDKFIKILLPFVKIQGIAELIVQCLSK